MRIFVFIIISVLYISTLAQGKYILVTEIFEWKAGLEKLDTVQHFSVWQTHKTTYDSGRKHEEIRIIIELIEKGILELSE